MTSTPIERAAQAAADATTGNGHHAAGAARNAAGAHAAQPKQAPEPRTTMGVVHRDLVAVGHAIASAVPVLEAIAVNPLIDELVAEALEALHAGGLEPVLQAAVDSLRAARLRQQQPQFLPAPAMPAEGPQDGA